MIVRPVSRHRGVTCGACLVLALLAGGCESQTVGPTDPGPNPLPALLAVDPPLLVLGQPGATLTLTGEGFVEGARARWNGSDRPTAWVSATRLTLTASEADLAGPGTARVTVTNPAPGGGSSGEIEVVIGYPAPTLTSVSPDRDTLNAPEVTLTLSGQGFVDGKTSVLADTRVLQNTVASPTRLTATLTQDLLRKGGELTLTVRNPAPGGGTSSGVTFTVLNPFPVVQAVTPDTALTNTEVTLTVSGTGFLAGSVVTFRDTVVTTTWVSASRLTATVPADLATSEGVAPVRVRNPAPGGGTSEARDVVLRDAPPSIASLSPASASVGGGAFTLTIHGTRFSPSASVEVNGQVRSATVRSGVEIKVPVNGADVAAAGAVEVVVVNPGSSGASAPAFLPVVPSGVHVAWEKHVALPNNHIQYDEARRRLYASVPASHAEYGNQVVAIDPETGAVEWSAPVGSEPGRMALSRDGAFLYVVLNGAAAIARLDVAGRAKDLDLLLPNGTRGEDIETLPGLPRSVVVSMRNTCCSPRHEGVAIFDDAVMRPRRTQGHTGSNRITVGASTTQFYGYNNETTEYGFRRILVVPDGLQQDVVLRGLVSGFSSDIEMSEDRVFATNGAVVDVATMTRIGTIGGGGTVRPDVPNGRVHYFSGSSVTTFHYAGFTELGRLSVPGAFGSGSMVRWGADGLAFGSGAGIHLIRSPLVGG